MKKLVKKMFRDLSDHKIQFLSIFIMAFIGVFAYTGISGEVVGITDVSTHYYEDTNLADGWIYGEDFDKNTLKDIQEMEEVQNAHREMVVDTVANYSSDPDITLHVLEGKQDISKFHLFKGKDFNPNDEEGIWIDKRFSDNRNLDIGDKISLKYNGTTISKTIRGIMYSPEYVYYMQEGSMLPDFSQVGFAYISSEGANFDLKYNRITIDSYEELDNKEFSEEVNDVLGQYSYAQFVPREDNVGVSTLQDENGMEKILASFSWSMFLNDLARWCSISMIDFMHFHIVARIPFFTFL